MPHGPRRFAKNSADTRHFRLIARSGYDSNNGKAGSTPLVLEPFVQPGVAKHMIKEGADQNELLAIPESLQALGAEVFGTGEVYRGDRSNDGSSDEEYYEDDEAALDDDCYFPKDGYNYDQHLRTVSTEKKKVPGVVMDAPKRKADDPLPQDINKQIQQATTLEEEEVMAALDDAELYEEFDDDFLAADVLPGGAVEPEVALWGPAALDDMDLPDLALFKAMHAERMRQAAEGGDDAEEGEEGSDDEGVPEPAGVDDSRFAQLLENEYGDEEIGELEDDDEIEGPDNIDLEAVLDEFLEDQQAEKQKLESLFEPQETKLDDIPRVTAETKAIAQRYYLQEDDGEAETSEGDSEEDESRNWDCESVLSTLSNVSNRPGKISKIKVLKKPGVPKNLPAIDEKGSDAEESEDDDDDDVVELPDVCTDRPKNETPEEKKQRKTAVKEMRRICRKMKKESKDMYKTEEAKLAKKRGNGNDVRGGLRTTKL